MSEAATPFPPRYRWLKRGLAIGACVLLALAALRWWWGREAQRRVDAVIADARARGEPILPEDFPSSPLIPDSENAAVTYLRAAAAVKMTTPARDWEGSYQEPATASDFAMMQQIEADNSAALALARIARGQNHVNWGAPASPFLPPPIKPRLGQLRGLARVLSYSARSEFAAGHDIKGIELLRDMIAEGRAINARPNSLITSLVGIGVGNAGSQVAIDLSPSLHDGMAADARSSVAVPMRELIDDLLDERGLNSSIVSGLYLEAGSALSAGQSGVGADQSGGPRALVLPVDWLLQPVWAMRECEVTSGILGGARAMVLPNLPSASAMPRVTTPTDTLGESELETLSRVLGGAAFYPGRHFLRVKFVAVCDRRAAAIMLALRLYQFDHRDALPEKLSALVPNYLAALPADPMRADSGTFCYLPHARPPIIYSVGLNGKDDAGSAAVAGTASSGSRWNCLDADYQLTSTSARSPATAPSTQAQDDN